MMSFCGNETILYVQGMSCGHCKMAIEKELRKINKVQNVDVNIEEGIIKIQHGLGVKIEDLKKAVNHAGYEVI